MIKSISFYSEIKNLGLCNIKMPRNTQIKQIYIEQVMPWKYKSRLHNMSWKFFTMGFCKRRTVLNRVT